MRIQRQIRDGRRRAVAGPLGLVSLIAVATLPGCGGGDGVRPFVAAPSPSPLPIPSPSPGASPGPVAPAAPLAPPFRGKVAFFSTRNATQTPALYVMNPDGSNITPTNVFRNLSLGSRANGVHYMNANGTRFVVSLSQASTGKIVSFTASADGTGQQNITKFLDPAATGVGDNVTSDAFITNVSMNANGSQFLFPYRAPGAGAIASSVTLVTVSANGTGRITRYTAPAAIVGIESPIFAPDDATIYFVGRESVPNSISDRYAIYRLAPGATVATPVASPTFTVNGPRQLSISPDGTRLTFSGATGAQPRSAVFIIGVNGAGLRQLTPSALQRNENPSFSPDGTKVIFTSDRADPNAGTFTRNLNTEIYSVNLDGTNVTRLTYNIVGDEDAATRAARNAAKSKGAGK